jgi:hypothetical protein
MDVRFTTFTEKSTQTRVIVKTFDRSGRFVRRFDVAEGTGRFSSVFRATSHNSEQ